MVPITEADLAEVGLSKSKGHKVMTIVHELINLRSARFEKKDMRHSIVEGPLDTSPSYVRLDALLGYLSKYIKDIGEFALYLFLNFTTKEYANYGSADHTTST